MFIPLPCRFGGYLGMLSHSVSPCACILPLSLNWELLELMTAQQIPSSVNRIYSLIHPDATNFGLNLVGCFVLPLQGFWNAIIYFSTSFSICKELWSFYISSRLRWNRVSGVQNIPLCERRVRHEIWHTEYSVFVRG